jgi:hypothetical protein
MDAKTQSRGGDRRLRVEARHGVGRQRDRAIQGAVPSLQIRIDRIIIRRIGEIDRIFGREERSARFDQIGIGISGRGSGDIRHGSCYVAWHVEREPGAAAGVPGSIVFQQQGGPDPGLRPASVRGRIAAIRFTFCQRSSSAASSPGAMPLVVVR